MQKKQNKKFKLTKESKTFLGIKMFRIQALVSFGIVEKGEKGGFVEKAKNLSVSGDARVYGNARVSGNALVSGKLKLKIGYFFGILFKGERLMEKKLEDGIILLYK